MDDYAFFAQIWRWQPSEIDKLTWSQKKELKEAYNEYMANKRNE